MMSNLFGKKNNTRSCLLRLFTTALMTLMIIFGINLVNRSNFNDNQHVSLFNTTQVSADVADVNEIKYVLHGVDLYGDPLNLPFNNQEITVSKPDSRFDSSFDASDYLKASFGDGRYTFQGYYTDLKTEIGKMYYRDQKNNQPNFKYIYVNYPERQADVSLVNVYFVYRDNQSTRPNEITLTNDALTKEPDKIKLFYTDMWGNQLKDPQTYANTDIPTKSQNFPINIKNYKFTALVMRQPERNGTYVFSANKLFAGLRANVPIGDITYQHIYPLDILKWYGINLTNLQLGSTNTFVYEKFGNLLTVNYIDENNQPIAGQSQLPKLCRLMKRIRRQRLVYLAIH